MRRAMHLWITAAKDGEMDLPLKLAIVFAYMTAPIIGLLCLFSKIRKKLKK